IEEVQVLLRGYVRTCISRNNQKQRQLDSLLSSRECLWTRGIVYPSPGTHSLTMPFSLELPESVPPSFDISYPGVDATIRYFVEIIGVRPGALRTNFRSQHPLAVVSPDPVGAQVRTGLRSGWNGPWKVITENKRIRRGFWGEFADVSVELAFPLVPALPLHTQIPFRISVSTLSKTLDSDDGKEIWPVPPMHPEKVHFKLKRRVHVKAGMWSQYSVQDVSRLGGMGRSHGAVEICESQCQWVPLAKSSKGKWRQRKTFRSSFRLSCPPTFTNYLVKNEYFLYIEVPFSGFLNNLCSIVPVTISSGKMPRRAADQIVVPSHLWPDWEQIDLPRKRKYALSFA
ncbi:uncharacterized protein LAESUDRAFT_639836, partial [Laetiporus sulphureus 93-53]